MAKNITAGIDIGTFEIKVAICESNEEDRGLPRVLGLGSAESRGLRRGYIVNPAEATRSILQAVRQAEKQANTKVKRAYVALGGVGLGSTLSAGSIMISRADSEITDLDVSQAILASERELSKQYLINRKVIHTIPLHYKIDGKPVWGRPHGMKAMKLEARTLFITCLEQHINDTVQALEEAGIEVEDIIASPIAASLVTASKLQKTAGCVVANIGGETSTLIVFENNIPISLEVLPIGGMDITHDIALGLKISIEEAEEVKRTGGGTAQVSKRKLDEVIDARLSDIFELIDDHLRRIGRSGLLPAGIVLTGGGSHLSGIAEFAKDALRLPSKVSDLELKGNIRPPTRNATFAVAYGLSVVGLTNGEEDSMGIGKGIDIAKGTGKKIMSWIKQFLP